MRSASLCRPGHVALQSRAGGPAPIAAVAVMLALASPLSAGEGLRGGAPGEFPGEFLVLPSWSLGYPIAACGEIVYDEICERLFLDEELGLLSFEGVQEYDIGAIVRIEGFLCTACLVTPCGSSYAPVLGAEATPCTDPSEPSTFGVAACTTVVELSECGLLLRDDLGNLYLPAEPLDPAILGEIRLLVGQALFEPVACVGPQSPVLLIQMAESTLAPCAVDLDADGDVDGADLGVLLAAWGDCPTVEHCAADLDGNNTIDGGDLGILLAAWSAPRP